MDLFSRSRTSAPQDASAPFFFDRYAVALLLFGWFLAAITFFSVAHGKLDTFVAEDRSKWVNEGIHTGSIDLVEDPLQYVYTAQNIVWYHTYSTDLMAPFTPSAFRTPGYPLFLAAFIALHVPLFFIFCIQALLGACIPVGVYFLGRQLVGRRVGVVAGVLFALLPMHQQLGFVSRTEVLLHLFFLPAMILYVAALRSFSKKRWYMAAFFFGCTALVKPFFFYIFPAFLVLPLLVWWQRERQAGGVHIAWLRYVLRCVVFVCIFFSVLAPWLIRNTIHFGSPIISTVDRYQRFAYWLVPYYTFEEGMDRAAATERAMNGFRAAYHLSSNVTIGMTEEEPYASMAAAYTTHVIREEIGVGRYVAAHVRHSIWFVFASPFREPLHSFFHLLPDSWFDPTFGIMRTLMKGEFGTVWRVATAHPGYLLLNLFDGLFFAWLYMGMLFPILLRPWKDPLLTGFAVLVWLLVLYLTLANGFAYGGPRHRYPIEPFCVVVATCGWALFVRRRSSVAVVTTS